MDGTCAAIRLAFKPAHIYCVPMLKASKSQAKQPYEVFGKLLLDLRKKAGIATQAELARRVKSEQQTVSRWEAGLSRPRDTKMPVIAQVLNADVNELLKAAGYATK